MIFGISFNLIRFDLNNSGGVKTRVFLRLINYKPYQLENLSRKIAILRSKSCIMDKFNFDPRLKKLNSSYLKMYKPPQEEKQVSLSTAKSASNLILKNSEFEPKSNVNTESTIMSDSKLMPENDSIIETSESSEISSDQNQKRQCSPKNDLSRCKSSSSEMRIKSMAHILKNSNKFVPNDDLVGFLNRKLNEGYILLKMAFEYIDPDHLGHLLLDEFRIVLKEFNIRMSVNVCKDLVKK